MIGKNLGHYKIVSELDRGGMGVVYVAEDPRLNRLVAVKCVSTNLEVNSSAKDRFLREARSVAAIEHDNICAIHDVGVTDDGVAFFVMPQYDGQTLKSLLAGGPVDASECTRILST